MSTHYRNKVFHAYRDGVCMKCGIAGQILQFHHINHDDRDDRIRNLVCLCKKCHMNHHVNNGKSAVIPDYLAREKLYLTINKFNLKYAKEGGVETLRDMALNKKFTLEVMGKHFGVTREYIRQLLFLCGIRKGKQARSTKYEIMERGDTMERRLKNLYKWIIDKNMLIGEFANESGIPATRLSCILTGKVTPNYKDLSKIRLVTGLSFEDILSDSGSSGKDSAA